MTTNKAREVLTKYQEWRKYDGPIAESPKMPNVKDISMALDVAIGKLSKKCGTYCNPHPVLIMVKEQKPYKQQGDRNSYSEYNEGWSDAVDTIASHLNIEI